MTSKISTRYSEWSLKKENNTQSSIKKITTRVVKLPLVSRTYSFSAAEYIHKDQNIMNSVVVIFYKSDIAKLTWAKEIEFP